MEVCAPTSPAPVEMGMEEDEAEVQPKENADHQKDRNLANEVDAVMGMDDVLDRLIAQDEAELGCDDNLDARSQTDLKK